jgi:hypothetical protein
MTIISERTRVEDIHYYHSFRWKHLECAGFDFACDENGNIAQPMNPEAQKNLDRCTNGKFAVEDKGVNSYVNSYVQPAVGRCVCSRTVTLHDPLDNSCPCGRWFNMGGQEVTPSHLCDDQGNPFDGC